MIPLTDTAETVSASERSALSTKTLTQSWSRECSMEPRRMLEIVFKDGLPVINQGESNVSQPGAIAENAGAPPPPTADHSDPPPLFEPVGVDDWSFDQICVPGFLY